MEVGGGGAEQDRAGFTYSAYYFSAATTLTDHVACAITRFPIIAAAILHIEPVAGTGTVAKGFVRVRWKGFIDAFEGQCTNTALVLDKTEVDETTCSREGIKSVEINARGNGSDNAGERGFISMMGV